MARAKRFMRTEKTIPGLGDCLIEVKETGVALHVRATGVRHSWTWDYLLQVCQCDHCAEDLPDHDIRSI